MMQNDEIRTRPGGSSLFKINEDVMPQVIIADESDRDSGRAAVRMPGDRSVASA